MKHFILRSLSLVCTEAGKCFSRLRDFGAGRFNKFRHKGVRIAPHEFSFECDGCGCMFVPTPDSFILTRSVRIVSLEAETEMCVIGAEEPLTFTRLERLNEI